MCIILQKYLKQTLWFFAAKIENQKKDMQQKGLDIEN